MKATVRDLDVLNAIQPLQVATYLRANGWHEQSRIADKATVWIQMTNSGEEFEILLPLKPESRDFPLLISQVLETLEIAERRSQLEILSALTTSSADVILVRVNHPDAVDGSMPIDDCVLLLQSARNMMMSAACSALEPKAYFPSRKPNQATKYLNRVCLGQTERGSYILTVISPVVAPVADRVKEVSSSRQDPFERKVTKTLIQALEAIRIAVEQAGSPHNLEPFNTTVQKGVSSNLCEALMEMNKGGRNTGLTIEVSWSSILSRPSDVPQKVTLPASAIPVIEAVAEKFKTYLLKKIELRGEVIKLQRLGGETGKVTILSAIEDKQRRIKVELTREEYELATKAHQECIPVVCYGNLIKEGRSFELQNPQNFALARNQ